MVVNFQFFVHNYNSFIANLKCVNTIWTIIEFYILKQLFNDFTEILSNRFLFWRKNHRKNVQ